MVLRLLGHGSVSIAVCRKKLLFLKYFHIFERVFYVIAMKVI